MQEESNFYNGKGEVMRAYEIQDTDRFTLSTEAFNSDAELAVGKYVFVDGTDFKLTTLLHIRERPLHQPYQDKGPVHQPLWR